jgi:hypothetical protein
MPKDLPGPGTATVTVTVTRAAWIGPGPGVSESRTLLLKAPLASERQWPQAASGTDSLA